MDEKMMQSSTLQFFEMLSQDQQLLERLSAFKDRETFLRYCVEMGKEKGYNFSTKEAEEFIELIAAQQSEGELSDQELEAVAGGGFFDAIKAKITGFLAKLRG